MVAPIYSNKKGIYRDLYREIDSDNKKKKATWNNSKKSPKGIYKELYKQIALEKIAFKNSKEDRKGNLFQFMQKKINFAFSKISYFFSCSRGEIKLLLIAFIFAKKPISSYIENNVQNSQYQGQP